MSRTTISVTSCSVESTYRFIAFSAPRLNDKPSTQRIRTLPRVFDFRKRDRFGVDAELTAGSESPELREELEDCCVRNASATAAVNRDSGTAQCSGREGNVRASH